MFRRAAPRSLRELIENGDLLGVERSIKKDANRLDKTITRFFDYERPESLTPLMWAQHYDQQEIAIWLIEEGADVNLRTEVGDTALMMACRRNQDEIAQLLVRKGARVNDELKNGRTALIEAIKSGMCDVAEMLIESGAKVNHQDKSGWAALMWGCRSDHFGAVGILIDKGAKLELRTTSFYTALMFACEYGTSDTVELLVKKGAKLNRQNKEGRTALMLACASEQLKIVKILADKGANLDVQDSRAYSALMLCCAKQNVEMVKDIVAKGAKVNLQNSDGSTAMMLVCSRALSFPYSRSTHSDALECVKICYAGGAELNLKDKHGKDVLQIAKEAEMSDVVAFLEFALESEVAKLVLDQLKLPQRTVVALFDYGVRTMGDYELLDEADRHELGIEGGTISEGVDPRRESLPVRISKRISGVFTTNSRTTDCFLTHDWGADELNRDNHFRAAKVNDALKDRGLSTWFDEDRLTGDIVQQITRGIQSSKRVIVFVTLRYMEKLEREDGVDYCRNEFLTAANIKGGQNMIPCVMEPRMLDQSKWTGPLQFHLGTKLYVDFTTDEKVISNIGALVQRI